MNGGNYCISDNSGCVASWGPSQVQEVVLNGAYTFLGGGSTPVSENIPDGANVTVAGGTQLDLGDGVQTSARSRSPAAAASSPVPSRPPPTRSKTARSTPIWATPAAQRPA